MKKYWFVGLVVLMAASWMGCKAGSADSKEKTAAETPADSGDSSDSAE